MNKALWLKQVKCPLLSVSDLSTDHSTCELRSIGIKTPDSHCAWRLKVLLLGVSVTLKFSIILHPSLNQADKFYTDLHIGVVKLILWARKPNRKKHTTCLYALSCRKFLSVRRKMWGKKTAWQIQQTLRSKNYRDRKQMKHRPFELHEKEHLSTVDLMIALMLMENSVLEFFKCSL